MRSVLRQLTRSRSEKIIAKLMAEVEDLKRK